MTTQSILSNTDLTFLFTVICSLGASASLLLLFLTRNLGYLVVSAPFIGVLLGTIF